MSIVPGETCSMANTDEQGQTAVKKKRNLPGTPDPDAEVIALSPRTLMATNRFSCEVCGKGFQRDQNLQLHRRGHNLPWKLKQREGQETRKKVYVCPEITCVHHHPSRALGDLTGIKKHYSRKHGEKKWKCEKCSKKYAVFSDYKAHQKVCGTREYRCDCGTLFSRRDSFVTHRAFCDALAEENAKATAQNQVESQQSDCPGEDVAPSVPNQELSSSMDLVSSSLSQPMSIAPDSDVCESSVQEAFKPSNCTVDVSNTSSTSPKWIQDGLEPKSYKPSKGPALSLHLGTGPGPGPPQVLGCLPETPAFMEMNRTGNSFSEGEDKNKRSSSAESTGILIGPSPQVYEVVESLHNSIPGSSTGASSPVVNFTVPNFAPPTAGSMLAQNYFRNPLRPLVHQRHYTASGQMPATALLQKAAMMGATASNPYLLRNLGLRADASSLLSGRAGQDLWAQPTLSSTIHAFPADLSARRVQHFDPSHEYGAYGIGSFRPMVYGDQGNVQDFTLVNPLFSGTTTALKDSSTDVSSSPIIQRVFAGDDSRKNHAQTGNLKLLNISTLTGSEGLKSRDKGEIDRTTLDFLGVDSISGKEAVDRSLELEGSDSHYRAPSTTSLYAGMKMEPAPNMQAKAEGRKLQKF